MLLHSLPEHTPNPLALEPIFDQNARFGGRLLCVYFAHVVGDAHDDFCVTLGGRHKTRADCGIQVADRRNLVSRWLANLKVAIVEAIGREPLVVVAITLGAVWAVSSPMPG